MSDLKQFHSFSQRERETDSKHLLILSDTFPYQRVTVTGGAGFLGRYVIEKLQGYDGVEVFVPRSRDYNLIEKTDIDRMLGDSQPDLVIHLAAVVGGIGYNQKNPGKFFLRQFDDGGAAHRTVAAARH